jgi:hypothetical protein
MEDLIKDLSPVYELPVSETGDQCYDFINIFAIKFGFAFKKLGILTRITYSYLCRIKDHKIVFKKIAIFSFFFKIGENRLKHTYQDWPRTTSERIRPT